MQFQWGGFYAVYGFSFGFTVIGLFYICVIPESLTKRESTEIEDPEKTSITIWTLIKKANQNIIDSIGVLRRKRPNGSRKLLIFTLFLMIFTGTGKNHSSTYLYTQKQFNWGVSDYTNYMSFYVGMAIIRTFITTPLYCYGLKLHDCMLCATGLTLSIANNAIIVRFVPKLSL